MNQETRGSFRRSVLANARMFAEVDRQIRDLMEQISVIASNTVYIQQYNTTRTLSDVMQMQTRLPGKCTL